MSSVANAFHEALWSSKLAVAFGSFSSVATAFNLVGPSMEVYSDMAMGRLYYAQGWRASWRRSQS